MERWEFDRREDPPGWRWLRIDVESQYVRRCCDRYFETLRECVEDAVRHGYEVPVRAAPGLRGDRQQSPVLAHQGQTPSGKARV